MTETPTLVLRVLAEEFSIHRLEPSARVPAAVSDSAPSFVGRTAEELSIVCRSDLEVDSERSEPGWRGFVVAGPLDFSLVGILARLTDALARAEVSVFAVSTFDTDYLLVRREMFDRAVAALEARGHTVEGAVKGTMDGERSDV